MSEEIKYTERGHAMAKKRKKAVEVDTTMAHVIECPECNQQFVTTEDVRRGDLAECTSCKTQMVIGAITGNMRSDDGPSQLYVHEVDLY